MIDSIGLGGFLANIVFLASLMIVLPFAYFLTKKLGQWWALPLIFFIGGVVSFFLELGSFLIFYFLAAVSSFLIFKFWKKSRVIF